MTIQIIKLSSEVKNIFFDFDGVIIDSNKFKENAIEESIALYCNDKFKADKALAYFVPGEVSSDDKERIKNILA